MYCLWTVPRLYLDCLWTVFGQSMDYLDSLWTCLWTVSGQSMDCLSNISEMSLYVSRLCGLSLDCLWTVFGPSMDCLWTD